MNALRQSFKLLTILCISITNASAQTGSSGKLLTLLPPATTGVDFRNDLVEDEKMFMYMYENLYIGGGVTVGDINNDGLQDLYFSSTRGQNRLYLNEGNFKFRDITQFAGVDGGDGIKTGINMVDINNDGYLDIFVCKSGFKDAKLRKKIFYINNRNNTFTNRAAEMGLEDVSFTIQSYFLDYDNDGDKDVYFVNHPDDFSKSMMIPATMVNGKMVYVEDTLTVNVSDRLYENRGGKFFDVTKKAGLIDAGFGLSASIADFNNDGWPDIYTANDFNRPDFIYINNKNGTFTNRLTEYVKHTSFSSMGSDISDFNNDGHEDIMVVDMAVEDPVRQKQLFAVNQNYDKFQLLLKFNLFYQYPRNMFQLNNGNGTFSEIGNYAGVAETEWSWGTLMFDIDNDGWKDMYVTNGLKRDITDWDYKVFVLDSIIRQMNSGKSVNLNTWLGSIPTVKVKNYFYHNNGSLKMDKYIDQWSDAPGSISSGVVYADLDNDGDLDIVVNNMDDPAFIFKNNSREMNKTHYLRLQTLRKQGSPEEVYGTKITITDSKGRKQYQRYDPQRGFISSVEHFVHFGTGNEETLSSVEIIFPSQKRIVLENVKTDQTLQVFESNATPFTPAPKSTTVFKDAGTKRFAYTQIENDYIDFKREPLIPYKCSRKGPYFAKADVNGDGKQDIFIGGSAGTEAKLMLQQPAGGYAEKKIPAFAADKAFEDMGAVFFDADGDKDMDLYVISGGAEFAAGSTSYQDRLYINDGKAGFTRSAKAIPAEGFNGSTVTALDYDGDGDTDLFVGGHVVPGKFPKADRSFLLQNNNGVFTDVTATVAADLLTTGIVNQSAWADLDKDGKNELAISGEWMAPEIYKYANGKFSKLTWTAKITAPSGKDSTINLNELTGWWYTMKTADVDNDGDMDIILGNRGTNSSIKGNINEPATVYGKDFDGNGSYDAVLGFYQQGKIYPLFSRDQLIDQMPMMRKKFVRYSQYSGTTLDQLFTPAQKTGMDIYKTNFFESGVLINEGGYAFRFVPFPERAQLSTINDLVIDDFDGDGIMDILAGGNSSDPAVMVGNYDATPAILLKGTGKGQFTAVPHTISGLTVDGEVRRIVQMKENNELILLKNNGAAQTINK